MRNFSAKFSIKALAFTLFFIVPFSSFSQGYGEVGIHGGVSYYLGDLNPGNHFQMMKPSFGGFVRHNFNERIAVNLSGTFGQITGDDAVSGYNPDRNLNFISPITDISATFEINFFEYFIGSVRHFITPYMFAGAGVTMFNPKGEYDGNLYELQPLKTEGQGTELYPDRKPYSRTTFNIPFGIGVKYSLNDYIGLSLSWTMHKAYSDYLDDVSKTYYLNLIDANPSEVGIGALLSDPTLSHKNGIQRGNSQNNDWYSFAGLSVSFRINYNTSKKCLNTFL